MLCLVLFWVYDLEILFLTTPRSCSPATISFVSLSQPVIWPFLITMQFTSTSIWIMHCALDRGYLPFGNSQKHKFGNTWIIIQHSCHKTQYVKHWCEGIQKWSKTLLANLWSWLQVPSGPLSLCSVLVTTHWVIIKYNGLSLEEQGGRGEEQGGRGEDTNGYKWIRRLRAMN